MEITYSFIPLSCFNPITKVTIWDINKLESCTHQFSKIYERDAEIVSNINTDGKYLVVEPNRKIFTLTILKSTPMCNLEISHRASKDYCCLESALYSRPTLDTSKY